MLKKVPVCKCRLGGTGGGPPVRLNTTLLEDELLELLSPDPSRMPGIPTGAFATCKTEALAEQSSIDVCTDLLYISNVFKLLIFTKYVHLAV